MPPPIRLHSTIRNDPNPRVELPIMTIAFHSDHRITAPGDDFVYQDGGSAGSTAAGRLSSAREARGAARNLRPCPAPSRESNGNRQGSPSRSEEHTSELQ